MSSPAKSKRLWTLASVWLFLTGCIAPVGPKYTKPDVSDVVPKQWSWQSANPRDHVPKGEWWKIFQDEELNALETRALAASPNVRAGIARVERARAVARASAANFFPDIRFNPSFERQRTSGNLPSPVPVAIPSAYINSYNVPLDLSYEIDLWGKVRRNFESARASAVASVADYNNLLLTLTTDVAIQYFVLRSVDSELGTLRRTIELRKTSLELMDQRFKAGTISEADVMRARTEYSNTRSELAEAKRRRQEASDTLALLCGEAAGQSQYAERPLGTNAPIIVPAGLPADLLERRPDIASSERLVAARNAEIGIAVATYFPSVKLTGQAGYLSRDLDTLFSPDSRSWSFGPSLSLPLTGYGLIAARVRETKAAREEAIANYRQAVLVAIKDVETSLAQIRFFAEQAEALADSVNSATTAEQLIRQRYETGVVSYFEMLDADRTQLEVERQLVQIQAQQHIASVRLIKALGGGWEGVESAPQKNLNGKKPSNQ